MTQDMTPEERQAFEEAQRHIGQLLMRATSAAEEFEAAQAANDVEWRVEAVVEYMRAMRALMLARLEVGQWSGAADFGFTQADAARWLLKQRQVLAPHTVSTLNNLIDIAFIESDDPDVPEVRQQARDILLQTDLVSAHELETFPKESLQAIVADRYRRWDDAN